MNRSSILTLAVVPTLLLASPGCKKVEEPAPAADPRTVRPDGPLTRVELADWVERIEGFVDSGLEDFAEEHPGELVTGIALDSHPL